MQYKFKARKTSSIINIRNFHNWIKRELLSESAKYLKENYEINNITLLDLAVGKAGDLNKWYDNNILNVIGFDIDEESIQEARRRYFQLLNSLKSKNVKNLPNYKFYVMDLSDSENIPKIKKILGNSKFNIVSCQFAIHYFFKNEQTLNTFIDIVSSYLDKNGFFIATTMNGNKLMELFKVNNIISNSIFKIESKIDKSLNYNPYGNKYLVSLGKESDTEHYFVGRISEEYIVDINLLKNICDKYGLMFIGITEFEKWYEKYYKKNLSDEEKQFSFLNFSFVFMPKRD